MKTIALVLLFLSGVSALGAQTTQTPKSNVLGYYDAELITINDDFISGINFNYQGRSYPLILGMSWQISEVLATDKASQRLAQDYATKNLVGTILIVSGAVLVSSSSYLIATQRDLPVAFGFSWGTLGLLTGGLVEMVGVPLYHSGLQDAVLAVNTYNRNKMAAFAQP